MMNLMFYLKHSSLSIFFNYFYFFNKVVVVKKLLSFFFLIMFIFSFAQQNEEFKMVKNYFDYQRIMLNNEFKKRFDKEANNSKKITIQNDFQGFMLKFDSIQNNALVNTLVRVKIREDLTQLKINKQQILVVNPKKSDLSKSANYPGGFNIMRQQIMDLFYTNAILAENKVMKTELLFVVEKDGSITSVHAEGDNFSFNRQAEIAFYLLPGKFSPALVDEAPIRYRFCLPLSMNFY